jgi:TPR repeat protein
MGAQHNMGLCYEHVHGDMRQAMSWYVLAADQGYMPACRRVELAEKRAIEQQRRQDMHDILGDELPEQREVVEGTRARANAGDPQAQHSLAVFYEMGITMRRDMNQAMVRYRAAAAQGHPESIARLREFEQQQRDGGKGWGMH